MVSLLYALLVISTSNYDLPLFASTTRSIKNVSIFSWISLCSFFNFWKYTDFWFIDSLKIKANSTYIFNMIFSDKYFSLLYFKYMDGPSIGRNIGSFASYLGLHVFSNAWTPKILYIYATRSIFIWMCYMWLGLFSKQEWYFTYPMKSSL